MHDAPNETRLIRANDYRRERWKNGLGWTREIMHSPAQGDWDWRLSIAEIEEDAPFSRFDHVDRELVLLAGNGLSLHFDDGTEQVLLPPHDRARFPGEVGVTGSISVVHALMAADLVDEYRLFVYPLVQGRGRRLFPANPELVEAMDRVQQICSTGSSLRKAANLRVRLPLQELTVVAPGADALEGFAAVVADELNLRSVRLLDAGCGAGPARTALTLGSRKQ